MKKKSNNVNSFLDSLTGAQAGIDSGANVILIPQKPFDTGEHHKKIEALRPKLAAILSSMLDFKPEEFGLPPYN